MKKQILSCGAVIVLIAAVCMFTACADMFESDDTDDGRATASELTHGTKVEGVIDASNTEQWYKFTATDTTQSLRIYYHELDDLNIQTYDHNGKKIGDQIHHQVPPNMEDGASKSYTFSQAKIGQVYYIKLSQYSSSSGRYGIMVYSN